MTVLSVLRNDNCYQLSMGAYLNVISALNLTLHLSAKSDVEHETDRGRVGQLPVRISLTDYPQLKELAWHVQGLMSYLSLRPIRFMSVTSASWRLKASLTVSRSLLSRLRLHLREWCFDV